MRQFIRILILFGLILLGLILLLSIHQSQAVASVWVEAPALPPGLRTGMLNLVPGFDGVSSQGVRYTVNNYGYRDDAIDWTKRHVVFLGDSTTFGLNIAHEYTFPEVWERYAGQDWQAINTATPGHGSATEYAELKRLYADGFAPEWVVVGYFAKRPEDGLWDNTDWPTSQRYLRKLHALALDHNTNLLILYIPRKPYEIWEGSPIAYIINDFAHSENIPFISGAAIYHNYLTTHQLTKLPELFYSAPNDFGHPGILASRLIGEAIAEVIR